MNEPLFGVENLDVMLVLGILATFGIVEAISGYLSRTQRKRGDWIQEAGGFFALSILIKPAIVATFALLAGLVIPNAAGAWSHWTMLLALPVYLFTDDIVQYWYHRSAHEYEFLWKLHRPHHQAEEMGFFISYRNAGLYYILMPNLWWVGICLFLGIGPAVALGLLLKQLVIIGSHSTISWDKPLYKYKIFNPLISVLERIFITPAFHHAHHGKSMADGISDPNGNYGNMFSLWDQMFGTAMYTRKFPEEYGLQTDPKEEWTAAYFYPAITAKNPASEISRGFKKNSTATLEATEVHLEKGEKYLWCQCGKSKGQPFCDGMHHGSKFKPMVFEAKRSGKVRLCNCKETKAGPFCDDTHIQLLKEI